MAQATLPFGKRFSDESPGEKGMYVGNKFHQPMPLICCKAKKNIGSWRAILFPKNSSYHLRLDQITFQPRFPQWHFPAI